MTSLRWLPAALLTGLALTTPRPAHARLDAQEAIERATAEITTSERELPVAISVGFRPPPAVRPANQMLADGEIFLRMRDYQRAILVYSQVQERWASNRPAYAEAVFRAGEAFFSYKDYLSARTKFREIADHARDSEFRPYASRAVARLVDIAMRVDDPRDPKAADEVLGRIAALAPSDVDSTILYAKGKALYFKGDLNGAKASLGSVGQDGGVLHQARFVLGVIALKQAAPGKYATAIDSFKRVTDLPGDTEAHREVIDQAWLAIGRLFYEMDQLEQAILAYQHIDRASRQFDVMLYEIAWVYVRQEDQDKATRALDLLTLSNPDSTHAVEGELLKADILLRKAEFKQSLETYEHVRDELDPLRKKLDAFLNSGRTPAEYYDKLTSTGFDAEAADALPTLVTAWAREQQDGALAFSVVESVHQTRDLLTQSQEMLDKLQVAVRGNNHLKAIPELKGAYQSVLSVLNHVGRGRAAIGEGLDGVEPDDLGGDLGAIREQRRRLQAVLLGLPVSDKDFQRREDEGDAQWRQLSQQLQQRQLEIEMTSTQLQALKRYQKGQTGERGVTDPAQAADYQRRFDEAEAELKAQRAEAAAIRKLIEAGKVQAGLGDNRFESDADARAQYRDLLEREVRLVATQLGGSARELAQSAEPLLQRARAVETRAADRLSGVDSDIAKRNRVIRAQLDAEQAALSGYKAQLAHFDDEARLVVGEVARRNFALVRDKLTALVMRSEVGIVDQAWNERETRKLILRDRQLELKEQERLLDDELRQITNDGAGLEP